MVRKSKAGSGGSGEEQQAPFDSYGGPAAPRSSAPARAERRLLKVGADGRVLIPADWRQAMDLKDNDTLVAHLQDGELRLHGSAVGLRKAQAIARKFIRPGVSIVDELIADRRKEARREDGDG